MRAGNAFGKKDDTSAVQAEIINSCDSHELNLVFHHSAKLDSEVGAALVAHSSTLNAGWLGVQTGAAQHADASSSGMRVTPGIPAERTHMK